MGTAVAVTLVIVVVLGAGLLRESLRTHAVKRWCRAHGFTMVPTPEHHRDELIAWAERFHPTNASHWGIVLRSQSADVETTVAEHREKRLSSADRWHTLVVARVPGLQIDGVRITRAPSQSVRRATDAMTAPGRQVGSRLGIDITERPAVHPVGSGKWAVETVPENALAFWSSERQAAAIDAWPHATELAAVDDYILVRVPGLITASRLDDLLGYTAAARAFFTEAATNMSRRS